MRTEKKNETPKNPAKPQDELLAKIFYGLLLVSAFYVAVLANYEELGYAAARGYDKTTVCIRIAAVVVITSVFSFAAFYEKTNALVSLYVTSSFVFAAGAATDFFVCFIFAKAKAFPAVYLSSVITVLYFLLITPFSLRLFKGAKREK